MVDFRLVESSREYILIDFEEEKWKQGAGGNEAIKEISSYKYCNRDKIDIPELEVLVTTWHNNTT